MLTHAQELDEGKIRLCMELCSVMIIFRQVFYCPRGNRLMFFVKYPM